ncbi:MAG: hypothetical protein ACOYXT_03445 [Bacteroidota bacterium]
MKTNLFKSTLAIFFFAAIAMVSCDRDENLQPGTEVEEEQALEESSVAEDAADDALEMSYQGEVQLASAGGRVASDCPVITHDKVNKKIIIDFGDGCQGPGGRTRRGKIIVTYSGEPGDSIANRIITFENYFVNNKGITGTIELRDISVNPAGNLVCTRRLIDLTVTFPDGRTIVYNGSRTREWLSGRGDDDPTNNIYRITGELTGVSSTGRSFTHKIIEPIIADWSCAASGNFARVAGMVELTKLKGYDVRKRIIHYGDGVCDNVITVITFRRTYTVTITD